MTTTHLFVELLVIGFGALIWCIIFGAAATGTDVDSLRRAVEAVFKAGAGSSFVAFLPMAYVLGILTDRLADWGLRLWDKRHREHEFGEDLETYFDHRRTLVLKGGSLWEHLEYLRSRLRICRGWAANSLLIFLALVVYWAVLAKRGMPVSKAGILAALAACLLLFALSLFSWTKMNRGEYKKTKRQAEWLKTQEAPKEKPELNEDDRKLIDAVQEEGGNDDTN